MKDRLLNRLQKQLAALGANPVGDTMNSTALLWNSRRASSLEPVSPTPSYVPFLPDYRVIALPIEVPIDARLETESDWDVQTQEHRTIFSARDPVTRRRVPVLEIRLQYR
jgi:hypothetical protein